MMSARFARSISQRTGALQVACASRSISSNCVPAQKLRCIFEEYRLENFSRECPSRFKKEMIKAVECCSSTTMQQSGCIEIDSLNRVLVNIGRSDQLLSEQEMVDLLHNAGSSTDQRTIPTSVVLELVERHGEERHDDTLANGFCALPVLYRYHITHHPSTSTTHFTNFSLENT